MKITSSSGSIKEKNSVFLIAEKRDIDINTHSQYRVDYVNGASAQNTIPLFAKIYRKKGIILDDIIIEIKLKEVLLKEIKNLNSIGSTNNKLIVNFEESFPYPSEGDYYLNIKNINNGESAIDIEIYGVKA